MCNPIISTNLYQSVYTYWDGYLGVDECIDFTKILLRNLDGMKLDYTIDAINPQTWEFIIDEYEGGKGVQVRSEEHWRA